METKMNKYIFREYDIRGKVEELSDILIENIGKAFGTIVIKLLLLVGMCENLQRA